MRKFEKELIAVSSKILRMHDKCPVIYYHDIVEDGQGFSYQKTDVSVFRAQMDLLVKLGIKTVTFADIDADPTILAQDNVAIITFDDGYMSNYTYAYPICKERNIKFNIFLEGHSVEVGKKGYLTPVQIQEMYRSGYVGFGAHTWNHVDCRHIQAADYKIEFEQENTFIREMLNVDIIGDFCFPYGGYYEETIMELDKRNYYRRIYTSDGRKKETKTNSMVFGRIAIENTDTLRDFQNKVTGRFAAYRLFKAIKNLLLNGRDDTE